MCYIYFLYFKDSAIFIVKLKQNKTQAMLFPIKSFWTWERGQAGSFTHFTLGSAVTWNWQDNFSLLWKVCKTGANLSPPLSRLCLLEDFKEGRVSTVNGYLSRPPKFLELDSESSQRTCILCLSTHKCNNYASQEGLTNNKFGKLLFKKKQLTTREG